MENGGLGSRDTFGRLAYARIWRRDASRR
jgi:hypothetical protein